MEDIGRIAPRALKNHVAREDAALLAVIVGLWPRVAGRAIAEQARPVSLSGGALVLSASTRCWAVQLQALSVEICVALNKALGQQLVKRLRVRHTLQPTVQSPPLLRTAKAGPLNPWQTTSAWTDTLPVAGAASLNGLDPEVREVLSRSFLKYFARGTRGNN